MSESARTHAEGGESGFGPEKSKILVLLAAAQFLVVLDASITNFAPPSIGRALDLAVLSSIAASKTEGVLTAAQGAESTIPNALTEGVQLAFMVGSGFALLGAIVALIVIRSRDSKARSAPKARLR